MLIERKKYTHGNLLPEAFNHLEQLTETTSFHKAHTKRHPSTIYTLSVEKVMLAFGSILDEIEHINSSLFDASGKLEGFLCKALPNLLKELLSALQSHIDDCYLILKVLHPFSQQSEIFVEKWLEKVKHPAFEKFKNSIKNYRESFAPIINRVRHEGGGLSPIMIYSNGSKIIAHSPDSHIETFYKDVRVVGYFLEGVHPNGKIGPDCEIHPGNTAISLNHNLRYHFANLYRISHHLKEAITRTVKEFHSIKLPSHKVNMNVYHYDIESIAERVSKLSPLFFKNEFSNNVADIKFYRRNGSAELTIDTNGSKPLIWSGSIIIHNELRVDRGGAHQIPIGIY